MPYDSDHCLARRKISPNPNFSALKSEMKFAKVISGAEYNNLLDIICNYELRAVLKKYDFQVRVVRKKPLMSKSNHKGRTAFTK